MSDNLRGLLEQVILAVPEFMIDSYRDTPRCLWCKGWKKLGGHKPRCLRQRALKAATSDIRDLPLFGGQDDHS